jgi:acyl-CoA thioesterase
MTPHDGAISVTADWRQGRGAFGGLIVGAMIRAVEAATGDPERAVRTVTAELPGATVPGTATVATETLRRGNSLTCARASIVQGGETKAHAVVIRATSRPGDLAWQHLHRPDAEPWSKVPVTPWSPGAWPEFAQHFEFRVIRGLPGAGLEPLALGWVRPRIPGAARDAAYIAALADAWWPCALVASKTMRPMATIAYTLEIVGGVADLDPEAPLLYRAISPISGDGFAHETRELWGEDGRLVAVNHQTFALI